MPQDTKEIIQFKHVDQEQVAEKQQAAGRVSCEAEGSVQEASNTAWWKRAAERCAEYLGVPS